MNSINSEGYQSKNDISEGHFHVFEWSSVRNIMFDVNGQVYYIIGMYYF